MKTPTFSRKFTARLLSISLAGLLGSVSARAQTFLMKDGREISAKGLRRAGDILMATVELPRTDPSQPVQTGELGYPLAQIFRINFPDPPQLRTAVDLITQGKDAEALAQLDPVIHYYQGFHDAPGSWWVDASLLQVQAFLGEGKTKDADAVAADVSRMASAPDGVFAAKALVAASAARNGNPAGALEMCEAVLKDASRPDILASACVTAGESHLARKEWEPALLSYLQVPVFYPEEKLFLAPAMLGAGRAYLQLEEFSHAKSTLDDLIATYGGTPEARAAKTELEKVAKAERLAALKK